MLLIKFIYHQNINIPVGKLTGLPIYDNVDVKIIIRLISLTCNLVSLHDDTSSNRILMSNLLKQNVWRSFSIKC